MSTPDPPPPESYSNNNAFDNLISGFEPRMTVKQATLTLQIILCALVVGILGFSVVVILPLLGFNGPARAWKMDLDPFILVICCVILLQLGASVIASKIMRRILFQHLIDKPKPSSADEQLAQQQELLQMRQSYTIMGAAIIEGAAFLGLAISLLFGNVLPLPLVGLCVLAILLHLPSVRGTEHWLAVKEKMLSDLRAFKN